MVTEHATSRILPAGLGRVRWIFLLLPFLCVVALLAERPRVLLALVGAFVFVIGLSFLREWLILLLYALIAFSVEIDFAGGEHAITLPTEALIPLLFLTTALTVAVTGRLRYVRSPLNLVLVLYLAVIYGSLLFTRAHLSVLKC